MPNDATVTREETELIFSGHRVYKLFTTPSVTIDVLNDLLRLDNKMNTKPVFISIDTVENSPFAENGNSKGKVLVMRRLEEGYFLSDVLKTSIVDLDLEKVANKLHHFHNISIKPENNFGGNYLSKRFISDYELLSSIQTSETDFTRLLELYKKVLEENIETINHRFDNGKIVEGHGDLDLGHVHYDNGEYSFIDFSHNTKYRFDDVSRDVGGLYLDFIRFEKPDLASSFLENYIKLANDNNLDVMVKLQVIKKALLRYFIHAGGFSEKHISKEGMALEGLHIAKLLKHYENT